MRIPIAQLGTTGHRQDGCDGIIHSHQLSRRNRILGHQRGHIELVFLKIKCRKQYLLNDIRFP